MKKVVINTRFGGFGLSNIAQKRYLELCGKKAFFYERKNNKMFVQIPPEKDSFISHTITEDLGEVIVTEVIATIDNKHYWSYYSIERDDPKLIQVVEELGKKANGRFADLKVIEIPDDLQFTIEEYDGKEHIAEIHRTWE